MTRSEARKMRKVIELAVTSIDDKNASISPDVFPQMRYNNELIKSGTRINWNGIVKRAASDLWDTELNNPDNAPTLWEDISYKDGYRIIPEVITVTSAFALNEIGWWGNELYRSLLDANINTPAAYPQGWEKISNETDSSETEETPNTGDDEDKEESKYRTIPEVITTDTAFALNEYGWWEGKLYKSLLASNVYTPAAYPQGWELVE